MSIKTICLDFENLLGNQENLLKNQENLLENRENLLGNQENVLRNQENLLGNQENMENLFKLRSENSSFNCLREKSGVIPLPPTTKEYRIFENNLSKMSETQRSRNVTLNYLFTS